MYTYFLAMIFFLFSIIYFFLGLKKHNVGKTQYFMELYLCGMTLLSVLSFFYGLYYALQNHNIQMFIYRFEFCIYTLIFPIIANLLLFLSDDKSKNIKAGFYYIPSIIIGLFFIYDILFYELDMSIFKNKDFFYYIFLIYTALFILISLFFILKKILVLKSKKDKIKFYIFLIMYISSCAVFIYTYVYIPTIQTYSVIFSSVNTLIFLTPMILMYVINDEFFFGNDMSDSIIKNIMDSMHESIIITDMNNEIIYFNKKASEIIMPSCYKNIKDVFVFDRLSSTKLVENKSLEVYIKTKDGLLPSVMLYSNVYDKYSDIRAKIYIFQNIKQLTAIRTKLKMLQKTLEKKIEQRTKELKKSNQILREEIESRVSIEYQIQDIFCYDTLTGLYNRVFFIQELEKTIVEESAKLHALTFLDLDGFKSINDSLGHSYGDAVLIDIANRLRSSYKYKNTIISRFSGDEFVILFKNITDENLAANYAQEILELIKEPVYFDNARVFVSASIGIAMYPKDGKNTEDLIKSADTAMYKSKENGKNQYKFFEQSFREEIQKEYDLTHSLINAIYNNEFILYYQPQISIDKDDICITGLEALMRWNKDGNMISPGVFIPVAEKSNMISEMGKWAIFKACEQCAIWNKKLKRKLKIAVNLSSNQLMNPMLYDEVSSALMQTKVDPSCIEFEITETSIVKNLKQSIEKLRLLKELGVRIAVDDFGTKYATFNYLKQLPVDKIKIDRSFIKGIGNSSIDEAIMLSLISLSKELKVDIIAEGVEKKSELDFLVDNGCTNIQGFYFFKPMPVKDIDLENILDYKQKYEQCN